MSMALWNEPLLPAECDELVARAADAVVRRNLQLPAILLLEAHRPLGYLAAQGMIVATPLVGPLVGLKMMQRVQRLLATPGGLDALLAAIEERRETPRTKEPSPEQTMSPKRGKLLKGSK